MSEIAVPAYKITKTAVAFLGSVDAGKSSLVGCLTYNILDDGRGSARDKVAKHQHEITSGKTSDISTRAYDLNETESLCFVDLCGHAKYLRTTNYGLASHFVDYAILVVSCNGGMLPMTKQHLKLLLTYNIPFVLVITHIDQFKPDVYEKIKNDIKTILKREGGKKTNTIFVNDANDQFAPQDKICSIEQNAVNTILDCLLNVNNGKQMQYPILSMSNTTGAFLNVLKSTLLRLVPRLFWTPGGKEMVTENKIVKQQLNSLERQYDRYGENEINAYRNQLMDELNPHPDIATLVTNHNAEKQKLLLEGQPLDTFLKKYKQIFGSTYDDLVRGYTEKTVAKYAELFNKQKPEFPEFTGGIFYIDSACSPPGTQLVITGIHRGAQIIPGQSLWIGPIGTNDYIEVRVKTLHNNVKQFVTCLNDHDRGCISIAPLKKAELTRKHIKKGTVALTSEEMKRMFCFRFKAIIRLFDVSVTWTNGSTPVVHLHTIAQPARIIVDPVENGGSKEICFDGNNVSAGVVTFKFKIKAEAVEPFNLFILRSGEVQGLGMINDTLSYLDDPDGKPDPVRPKRRSTRTMKQKSKTK